MEITFLGTSSGTPTKTRNVTGLALNLTRSRGWFLVDCGEATQHQLLRTPYSLHNLNAVCITHIHGDHCYGLPGLLASAALAGRKKSLTIIAPQQIRQFIETVRELTQLTLTYEIDFIPVESLATAWECNGIAVESVALSHRVPSFAFVFTEREVKRVVLAEKLKAAGIPEGPIWGALKRGEDVRTDGGVLKSSDFVECHPQIRRIVVGGDNDRPELLSDVCGAADVLIHEATYTEDVAEKVGLSPQHSTAARVARFAEAVGLPSLILTHFSPRYADTGRTGTPTIDLIEAEAKCWYQGTLFLAKDFETYRLSATGALEKMG